MPVKRLKSGRWKAGSYTAHTATGGTKWFKGTFKTKAAAERRAATSKRRSKRKRSESRLKLAKKRQSRQKKVLRKIKRRRY